MTFAKKLITWAAIVTLLFSSIHSIFANEGETSFIITAYYSPLKWQNSYFHGSYEREIYVNGEWTHGASGKAVFEWMLAAPKKYPFGTKIYFEGFGVAEVQDRGWAIVSAGSRGNAHDRIDIWMGYGDIGRERALQWGRRTVKGKIVWSETPNNIKFSGNFLASQKGESFESQDALNPQRQILLRYWELQVDPDSSANKITTLQNLFTELGEYSGEIDGKYSSIERTLLDLQKELGIIVEDDDWGGWHFGNKTRSALWEKYNNPEEASTMVIKQEVVEKTQKEVSISIPAEPIIKEIETNLSSTERAAINSAVIKMKERFSDGEIKGLSLYIDTLIESTRWTLRYDKLLYLQELIR